MYKYIIPRKNQHWVYFHHSNSKVEPFGPTPVALGLKNEIAFGTTFFYKNKKKLFSEDYNFSNNFNQKNSCAMTCQPNTS